MGDARSLRRNELETLGNALACILQEENPLPPHEHEAREAELTRRLSSQGSLGSSSLGPLHSRDISIISRLLNQVHQLMVDEDGGGGEDGGDILTQKKIKKKPDSSDVNEATQKNMVDAVVEIAGAAAEAARAAAAASGKNLEVMQTLLSDYDNNVQPRRAPPSEDQNESARDAEAHEDGCARKPAASAEKDVVKRLERQNRITHWVLGLMIVATTIWRWKVLTMFLGVRRSFSNPFQTLGDMVSEGFKGGGSKEEAGGAKGFNKARTVLPSLLGGEEKEIKKTTEKTEHSTKEDFKLGEALTLSLGNLFPSDDKPEGNEGKADGGHESNGAVEDGVSSKE